MEQAPHTTTNFGNSESERASVYDELNRLLHSSYFNQGKRCPTLLKHIVQKTLEGETDELRERIIGYSIFDKSADYDTNNENVVRVTAGEIRKRLALYYQEPEHRAELRIEIPTGTYVAVFRSNEERTVEPAEGTLTQLSEGFRPATNGDGKDAEAENRPQKHHSRDELKHHLAPEDAVASAPIAVLSSLRTNRWRVWGIASAAACILLLASWIGVARWTKSELDLFWQPLLATNKPVIIYTGSAWVYVPAEWVSLSVPPGDQDLPMGNWSIPSPAEGQVFTANDIVIDHKGFQGIGELKASANLAALLTEHHRSFNLRTEPELPFADLHGSPVVLLGAYNNFWSMDLTQSLPFFFDRLQRIRERGRQGRVWSIVRTLGSAPPAAPPEDYAIVSRLFDTKTGSSIISLEGMTTCGTLAAGEFVTDPAQLSKLASMGRDALEHKNIELVLHGTFVDCTPTSIDIVAARSW